MLQRAIYSLLGRQGNMLQRAIYNLLGRKGNMLQRAIYSLLGRKDNMLQQAIYSLLGRKGNMGSLTHCTVRPACRRIDIHAAPNQAAHGRLPWSTIRILTCAQRPHTHSLGVRHCAGATRLAKRSTRTVCSASYPKPSLLYCSLLDPTCPAQATTASLAARRLDPPLPSETRAPSGITDRLWPRRVLAPPLSAAPTGSESGCCGLLRPEFGVCLCAGRAKALETDIEVWLRAYSDSCKAPSSHLRRGWVWVARTSAALRV